MGTLNKFVGAALFMCVLTVGTGSVAQQSRIPDRSMFDAMLNAAKPTGWVQFRNYNGNQLVYFSPVQVLHCRLKEIRYSINSTLLDERFPIATCVPQIPFALKEDEITSHSYLTFEPDSVGYVAVQLVWDDDTESDVAVYKPCDDVGENNCAWPVE